MSILMIQDLSIVRTNLRTELTGRKNGAIFSDDRLYRYLLWRRWSNSLPLIFFVGLNPSTADETLDDPTIRRCKAFAMKWGAGGFMIANLFAFRATFPGDLRQAIEPIGSENDGWIGAGSEFASRTIACWGNNGSYLGRSSVVFPLLLRPEYLRITKEGQPSHPLYLPGGLEPVSYNLRDGSQSSVEMEGGECVSLEK
jgi:hypothetical protein